MLNLHSIYASFVISHELAHMGTQSGPQAVSETQDFLRFDVRKVISAHALLLHEPKDGGGKSGDAEIKLILKELGIHHQDEPRRHIGSVRVFGLPVGNAPIALQPTEAHSNLVKKTRSRSTGRSAARLH